jgi:hypothetical protein
MYFNNFDSRLNPRVKEASEEELAEEMRALYAEFLQKLTLYELISRIHPKDMDSVAQAAIENITERDAEGKRDKEFEKTLDFEALRYVME